MSVNERQLDPNRSKEFTRLTDETVFESPDGHGTIHTTTVYLLRRPPENRHWIFAVIEGGSKLQFRHPLTLKLRPLTLPIHFDYSTLVVSHHTSASSFDKLLVVPNPNSPNSTPNYDDSALFALYDGGKLRARPPNSVAWVSLVHGGSGPLTYYGRFDDVVVYKGKVYGLDRYAKLYLIDNHVKSRVISMGEMVMRGWLPLTTDLRKRVVVDGEKKQMYLVFPMRRCLVKVYKLITRGDTFVWEGVRGFDDDKVLFISRDYSFFRRSSKYRNCIVFSEWAFPSYGDGCWEFSSFFRQSCSGDEIVGVFRLQDQSLGREGENDEFPVIHWSPISRNTPELKFRSFEAYVASNSSSGKRESDEDKSLSSDSKDEKNGEVRSDLKDSDSKDGEIHEVVECDSDGEDQGEEKMQCDSNGEERRDAEMHLNGNTRTPLPAAENEITTHLSSNGAIGGIEEETRKNIVELVPKASTSSASKSNTSEYTTTKFEGFDIRTDLVSTMQKIWQKHGNVVEKCIIRNSEIIARALESLATMVQTLEDNPAQYLSDSQSDYLASTLADLRCICFKVDWLVPYVEKAVKLHESKLSLESLNNLTQLSSQVKERKAKLLGELSKLSEEENKLKEEVEKVSKTIPFSGQLNFDEPIGAGLT